MPGRGSLRDVRPPALLCALPSHDPLARESQVRDFIDALSECVALLGAGEFVERFLGLAKLTGAKQVTAFAYEASGVRCILSQNFVSDDKGEALAAAYVDGAFRDDPLSRRALEIADNDCSVERLDDYRSSLSRKYLQVFFDAVGLRTKVAAIVAQDSLRMVLNLYFDRDFAEAGESGEARLFGLAARVLAAHLIQSNPLEYSPLFSVLSDRERQVCTGMLAGKKAETIAQEMGVAPSSIVTYRQRAYQKLGITSRGQLFSIGRPAGTQQEPGGAPRPAPPNDVNALGSAQSRMGVR